MGENSGQFGTKDISKNYPAPANTGTGANDYHEGRQINLVPEEESTVPQKVRDTI